MGAGVSDKKYICFLYSLFAILKNKNLMADVPMPRMSAVSTSVVAVLDLAQSFGDDARCFYAAPYKTTSQKCQKLKKALINKCISEASLIAYPQETLS